MEPMLATAVDQLPSAPGWSFEFKWDGVRALLEAGEHVRIRSRAGNDVTGGYPELAAQARDLDDALLDGEIVAFVAGRPSFEALQQRMHVRGKAELKTVAAQVPVTYVVFDVLRRFGVDLTARPWSERRATLERFGEEHPDWTISPTFDDGAATLAVAEQHGLEGVVAKRVDSRYRPGARSDDWRKVRFVHSGEFVVVGWDAAPEHPGTPTSLVLGVADDDGLRYAGRVGSGLSGRIVTALKRRFVTRADPPVADVVPAARGRRTTWVEPDVVVDVRFSHWTRDGVLRQPVFRGIRTDKRAEEARGDG